MNAFILRQLWSVVEQTQTNRLLKLSDTDLVQQLLALLVAQVSLSSEDNSTVVVYIHARVPLIRDLAQARLGERCGVSS